MERKKLLRWVGALASGKYEQGCYELQSPGTKTFCCLGVLCELENVPSYVGGYDSSSDKIFYDFRKYYSNAPYLDNSWDVPPDKFFTELGLDKNQATTLMQTNDQSSSFKDVIDLMMCMYEISHEELEEAKNEFIASVS